MSHTETFIKALQTKTGNDVFPIKFWEEYPEKTNHTFKEALDKYAGYYKNLSSTQQEIFSKLFWDHIKALGTPIIENSVEAGKCEVYFLFPKNDLLGSTEQSKAKKDLYLQGDFHGYDTTDGRQRVEELAVTGIMCHIDTMPRDGIVNYRYIQLEPSLRGREPVFDRPPFFGLSAKKEATRLIKDLHKALYESGQEYPAELYERYEKLHDEFEVLNREENSDVAYQRFLDGQPKADPPRLGLSDLSMRFSGSEGAPFWALENQCIDQCSQHRTAFLGPGPLVKEIVFRVNENPELARLPGKEVNWPSLLPPPNSANDQEKKFIYHNTFYSKLDGNLHLSDDSMKRDASNVDLFSGNTDSPYADCTRVIHVFKPANDQIDKVIVINDGMPYLATGIMDEFESMAEKSLLSNTALVFVTTLSGLEKTISQVNTRAGLQGLGSGRTIDYELQIDDYAIFIRDKLFPGLNASGIKLPEDPSNRVMIGSSLSGTAAINIGFKHPDLFGGIIAQSPSPSNRSCLKDVIASDHAHKSSVQLHLSCGLFEQPMYAAANANLMYAEELSEKLNVKPMHLGLHGHYFLAWIKALAQALPEVLNKMHTAQKDDTKPVVSSTTVMAKELGFTPGHRKKTGKDDIVLQPNSKNKAAHENISAPEEKQITPNDNASTTPGKRRDK